MLAPRPGSSSDSPHHSVVFYGRDESLTTTTVNYLTQGLAQGGVGIAIATDHHRDAIAGQMAAAGFDVAALVAARRLTFLDATDTLSVFMVDGWPDQARFDAMLSLALDTTPADTNPSRVHAYGEMVDVLWQGGNHEAALELERLWHAAMARLRFSLLCSYDASSFRDAEHADALLDVCALHNQVSRTGFWPEYGTP